MYAKPFIRSPQVLMHMKSRTGCTELKTYKNLTWVFICVFIYVYLYVCIYWARILNHFKIIM